MYTVRPGDLYFLDSPFHISPPNDSAAIQEKRLSYLLGTVSARPAVVIRGPSWWDKFNTVTVIPALSKGKPAIVYHLQDRYGHQTEAAYPFVPHNPHTIPVSRLGKYIGSMDPEELAELIYAFKWVHDPEMQADSKNYPVPGVYADVHSADVPPSWRNNRDARSETDIHIDKDSMTVRSRANSMLNGFPIGSAFKADVPTDVTDEIDNDQPYTSTTSPLPDSNEAKKQTDEPEQAGAHVYGFIRDTDPPKPQIVPVERDFPESYFSKDDLNRVASRFDISAAYYSGEMKTRDPKYLNEDEIGKIRGNMTDMEIGDLFDYYRKLKPMDAYILGPRLPTDALQSITQFNRAKAATLKRLCNTLRDIPDEDYNSRVEAENLAIAQIAADKEAQKVARKTAAAATKEENAKNLAIVQKFLNAKDIHAIKRLEEVDAFLALPMGVVKRYWSGTNFKDDYAGAKAFYKHARRVYDDCLKDAATKGISNPPDNLMEIIIKRIYEGIDTAKSISEMI